MLKRGKVGDRVKAAKKKLPAKKKAPLEYGPIEIRMLSEEEVSGEEEKSDHELIEELNGTVRDDEHKFESNRKYFTISIYALVTIMAAAIFICLIANFGAVQLWLKGLAGILSPFLAAFLIAFILSPLVNWLELNFFEKLLHIQKPKLRVALSIVMTYILLLGIIIVGLLYVIPQMTDSIVGVAGDVTVQLNEIYDKRHTYETMLQEYFPEVDFDFIANKIEEMWPTLLAEITNLTKDLVPKVIGMTVSVAKLTINIFLSIAISIYMLFDKRKLIKMSTQVVYAVLPTARAKTFCGHMRECSRIFSGFVSGKALDSLIIGIICFVATSILGLEYAVLISVIVGITNMIPYFGPFIGAVPGVVLYLCIRPLDAVVFAIMILILQQFDGWVLGPKILGDSTGLSPLWVIFGITVGGAYGGVIGMFLGVPMVAVVAYLLNQAIDGVLKKKRIDIS
ncbi:MAG: AI-2E family transporter [Lachnospiraceae bacterium]|nr:AI-2E family transporter [Lachnospiraceae bacterium]